MVRRGLSKGDTFPARTRAPNQGDESDHEDEWNWDALESARRRLRFIGHHPASPSDKSRKRHVAIAIEFALRV